MARRGTSEEVVALQSRPSSTHGDNTESGSNDRVDDTIDSVEQPSPRRAESTKKRACVLLGSAILQFPIWGKLRL